jgi:hypothetical protein
MKTQRELLELAAKAAGIELKGWTRISGDEEAVIGYDAYTVETWNPLTDDGDALRLAVKLRLAVNHYGDGTAVMLPHHSPEGFSTRPAIVEDSCGDPAAATRLAITRAAAAIGEGMAQSSGSTELPEDNYYKSQAEAEEAGGAAAIGEAIP